MRGNHNSKKLTVSKGDQKIEATSFEGIIPDGQSLREMEEVLPGSAERWMSLAEREIAHRHKMEDRITHTYKWGTYFGQILGFCSSILIYYVGYQCIVSGYPTQGAAIITTTTVGVISAFYFKSKNSS